MKQLIYKHTCIITNLSYIGQTIKTMEARLKEHIKSAKSGDNYKFQNALRKYGIENFTSEILECNIPIQSNMLTRQTLASEREMYYIEYYNTLNKGYNMTKGGEGTLGLVRSEEAKALQSKKMMGKVGVRNILTNETYSVDREIFLQDDNLISINKGRTPTSEALQNLKARNNDGSYTKRMSKMKKGMVNVVDGDSHKLITQEEYHSNKDKYEVSGKLVGEKNGMYGNKHSQEMKDNQSKLIMGKVPIIDEDGNKYQIEKTNLLWINKKVMSLTKLRQYKEFLYEDDYYQCPYCYEISKGSTFMFNHFDNCKFK